MMRAAKAQKNYKRRGRKSEELSNMKDRTTRGAVTKVALLRNDSKVIVKPGMRKGRYVAAKLVNSMNLDEMLEASEVVEMGIRGVKVPVVKSVKAQKYAGEILRLRKRASTKPIAEKMMYDLNVQILETNRKTTNIVESERLYQKLMGEE